VRGVNWLGDAVMSTPALLRLRERFPGAHITLLTPEKLADLWLHHPAVDRVAPIEEDATPWDVAMFLKLLPSAERIAEYEEADAEAEQAMKTNDLSRAKKASKRAVKAAGPYHRAKFDLALVLPNSPRSALEVWLARIPTRIGYARPWRNWFLTQLVQERPSAIAMRKRSFTEIKELIGSPTRPQPSTLNPQPSSAHHLHQYLQLTAALGANAEPVAPRLVVTDDEIAAAKNKFGLDDLGPGEQPVLALNPGAEYGPAKRWPVERFIEAASKIQQRTNCVWLILGGKNDVALAEQIQSALRIPHSALRNLAGQTSLRELMAVLKLCRVLLTNDTGPMHVAAALGTPVVVPFGSTSPELTGPGLPGDPHHRLLKSDAPCSPCFLRECPIDFRCMTGISVERVVEAVVEALKR